MRRPLLGLFGLILIGVLSYISFVNKAPMIHNDLLSKIEKAYKENNITGVNVNLKGQDIKITRVVILRGSVSTIKEKLEAFTIANSIKGVKRIENQITIKPLKEKVVEKRVIEKEVVDKRVIVAPKEIIIKKVTTEVIIKEEIKVETKPIKEKNVTVTKRVLPIVAIPIAIPKTVEVPIPVKAVTAPKVIQLKEKKEEISSNSKGVE